jgi:3-hydroxyacyl-CoA dehydrogenase
MIHIHSAAVLGAGTMGAQIAAHLANAGLPVLLFDLDRQTAAEGLRRATKLSPDPFFTHDVARLISLGGFNTDLPRLKDSDWIIEAVVERLDIKQGLMSQVEPHRSSEAIVSSNTSGIPIAGIAAGRSEAFRQHWLGTHFFNPPRYLPLLEVIPTADTHPDVVATIRRFSDHSLGKGVVLAKDTPGFIGNRIGMYGVMRVLELIADGQFSIEEVDAMSGPIIGRPKSAIFRTMDIAGIDILAHVSSTLAERLNTEEERSNFSQSELINTLVERGWIGEKSGQGFYKKERGPTGTHILTLDPTTMTYRERQSPRLPSLDAAQTIDHLHERLRTLFLGKDRVAKFLRATLGQTLVYTAQVAQDMAHSIDDIDRAMRWGYGWALGPFELWDAIGINNVLEACDVSEPPALIRELKVQMTSTDGPVSSRHFREGGLPTLGADISILTQAKEASPVVKRNPSASLVDLGDGVLAVEFHSKMNAIGGDTIAMLTAGVAEAERNFEALVVGNESPTFSAGANLMLVLLEAQEKNWDEIDLIVRSFQSTVLGLRYAQIPVVVAPAGLALGGGCEVVLHGDGVQAAAETYMGQVEVGVGLIPAGGGTKELLVRNIERQPHTINDPLPFVRQAFDLIGFGKVSTSAQDAKRLGLLRPIDRITMHRDRVLSDAKNLALGIAHAGYQPPLAPMISVGGDNVRAGLELGIHIAWRGGHISDHDALIGRKLARVLSGGDLPHHTSVSEQYLLDLEREAFLSLCGEPKTLERIAHTLKTGKMLRN